MSSAAGTTAKRLATVIRRYRDDDAEQVCALHKRVFPGVLPETATGAEFGANILELTEGNPWRAEDIGPLVIEDSAGMIRGFHCVIPRRFVFHNRVVRAAVCSSMCIDVDFRGYTGAELLRHMLSGPQDFSVSDDANDVAAHVSVHMGCSIYQLPSLRWTLPLRPADLVFSTVLKRIGMSRARWIGAGIPALLDMAAKRFPQAPAHVPAESTLSPRPVDVDAMAAALPRVCRGFTLRVEHSRESLAWTLGRAHRMTQAGKPRTVMICEQDGLVAGWFTYYLHKHGLADVVQFVSRLRFRRPVFDWLIRDAMQAGAAGLTGRLDPDTVEIIANQYALFQPQPHWVVVHSRDPEYTRAFMAGGTLLSRLEGEWLNGFPYSPAPKKQAPKQF
ncbi:MAG TPA: hypothetical protein PKJ41_11020 [Bryobacteraceae bacterium]|nr:hypothetical protein [Bryobacteraceae bacterium]HPT27597.1 hypothetical protein [Bryobacteraceae bacterium]